MSHHGSVRTALLSLIFICSANVALLARGQAPDTLGKLPMNARMSPVVASLQVLTRDSRFHQHRLRQPSELRLRGRDHQPTVRLGRGVRRYGRQPQRLRRVRRREPAAILLRPPELPHRRP